MKTLWIGLIEW